MKIKQLAVGFFIVSLFGWLIYLTWLLPSLEISVSDVMGNRKVLAIEDSGRYFYILTEQALNDGATINDSKGKKHFLMSAESMRAVGRDIVLGDLPKGD